jgi:hypothetical protein
VKPEELEAKVAEAAERAWRCPTCGPDSNAPALRAVIRVVLEECMRQSGDLSSPDVADFVHFRLRPLLPPGDG